MKKSAVVASILLMISIGFVPIVLMSCSNEIPIYTVRFDSRGGNAIEPIEALKNSKLTEPSIPSKTGYEFGGWYKDNSYSERWVFSRDMVRSDMTLYAKWNAHTYAVTYNGNGQSTGTAPPTQTKKHGESLALSTNSGTLQRNGYRFGGWNTQSDGFGANYASGTLYETDVEILLYAKWIAEEYNVTLNKQGGNSGSDSITATYDSAMPSATAPIKNGYLFDGYYDQVDGGAQYYSSTMVSSKVWDKDGSSNLYAKWTPAYTVSFNSQGGGSVSSLEGVRQGSKIGEPTAPTRNGYAFDGWFKDSSCVVAWDFDVETINSNTTLYAKWVVAYTVEFDSQGGSNIAALEGIRQGSKITAPTAPTKNGYVFQGWYKDSDYTNEWDFGVDTVETTVKLVAKWGVAIYTVSFNSQGGTEVTPITNILYGTKISEPVSPTRDRFVFGGWYRDSSYVQRYYFTTDVVTSSMILYAKWFLPHTVSFDSQGGSIVEDITDITHGDLIPEPLDPVKSGYAFDGWHKQSNYVEQWDFDADVITSDLTLYAKWIVLHLVSFDSRGGSGVAAIEVGNGRKLAEPSTPIKTGYTFNGWYKEIACINRWNFSLDDVESTRTLYAKWNVQNYTVTFDSQGGSSPNPASKSVTYDQTYGTLPTLTRNGYTFDGWWTGTNGTGVQLLAETVVSITSNQILYAKWLPQYTITFNSQAGSTPSPASKIATYGQTYGTLPSVSRIGYVFNGWWTGINGTGTQIQATTVVSITSNHTLHAAWSRNSFMLSFDSQGGTQPEPISKSVTYSQAYGELPTVTKEGYTFGGWWSKEGGTGVRVYESTTVSITSDQILYAAWHLPYSVSFDSQGGAQPEPASKNVTYDHEYGELPTVTSTGYTFGGWWTGINGTGTQIQATTVVSITSNQTLYAKWSVNSYTVSYNSQGGSNPNPANKSVTYGQTYGTLPSVSRSGYVFDGWWTGINGTGTQIQAATVVFITSNQTLYAKWIPQYTITFDSQEGSNPNPANKSVTYDQTYGTLPSVSRSGFVFDGWWTGINGTGTQIQATTVVSITSNQTLYAKWSANSYTVSFNSQGGSNSNPVNKSVIYGQTYGTLPSVSRSGYVFDGWWTEPSGIGDQVLSTTGVSITNNQTLYAKWIPQYTITFDSHGGSFPSPASKVVTYGQEYGMLATTEREGYVFDGWWTGINGTGIQIQATTVVSITSNQTLYAKWIPQYTITFDSQGGSFPSPASKVVTYGQEYGMLATTEREGYVFDGWWTEPNGMGEKVLSTNLVVFTTSHIIYSNWRTPEVGRLGQAGGYIFFDKGLYSDGWRYMETAPLSYEFSGKVWGWTGIEVEETSLAVGTGEINTQRIVSKFEDIDAFYNRNNYAASLCANLVVTKDGIVYDDWFLPSMFELDLIYRNLKDRNIGDFSDNGYWSSTEFDSNFSYLLYFSFGGHYYFGKEVNGQVRPVRAF